MTQKCKTHASIIVEIFGFSPYVFLQKQGTRNYLLFLHLNPEIIHSFIQSRVVEHWSMVAYN